MTDDSEDANERTDKVGRPPHKPTPELRRQVETMAGYGIPAADICLSVGVSPMTLRKHYRHELDIGHVKANSAVAQSLFKKATGDGAQCVTAAIFWAKTRMGWHETIKSEVMHRYVARAPTPAKTVDEWMTLVKPVKPTTKPATTKLQ